MNIENLLEFLNEAKKIDTLDCATCSRELIDYLDIIDVDEQFTQRIDMGIVYVHQKTLNQYTLVDGLNRILSLCLLLHAVCECYKKTTPRNDKAIKTIRKKYLIYGLVKTKLKLSKNAQEIYEKIIFGERLSGKEKEHPMFVLLHKLWLKIKENQLQASQIFKMLQKINITLIDIDDMEPSDFYHSINKNNRKLNQILLIDEYMKNKKVLNIWEEIKGIYNNRNADVILFLRDFLWNKFNFKEFDELKLYEYVVNYVETLNQYMKYPAILEKIKRSAELYNDLINVNMPNDLLKQAMIRLKLSRCDDTYAYLLSVYEDYTDQSITESTFLEILSAIQEYLENRQNTPNNVSFNELIQYLNAFLACK